MKFFKKRYSQIDRTYRTCAGSCPCCFFRNLSVLFLIILCSSPVRASDESIPLQREDFAYGMDLTVSGKHAIYGLTLPAAIYQGCTRADLGDLRIFNANHTVPHLLRPQITQETERPAQDLPFFPLFSEKQGRRSGGSPPDLRIAADSQGTIIDIRQNRAEEEEHRRIVTAYLLDTGVLEQPADWLELAWEGQKEQFSTSVRLEAGEDLNTWRTELRSAALAELRFSGHTLLRRRIAVPGGIHRKKYFRLSWPAGKDGVKVTAVKAGYNREAQPRPRSLLSLTGTALPVAEHGALRYQYDSKGFFPVDQLTIHLPEQNSLSQIAVFSRANAESSWKRRASFLAYRLTVDGLDLDNDTVTVARTTDRYWRLELEVNSGIYQAPILELGWLPGQLVFLAQGGKPYTLAYGHAGLKAAHYQVDRLLKAVDPLNKRLLVAPAQAGPQKILGGEEQLEVRQDLPWQTWLLWAVLITGVLIVGGMALKLYREMSGPPPQNR